MKHLYKPKLLATFLSIAFIISGISFTSFAADQTDNLVAYYSFNDPWNLGKDSSGNNNNLESVNAANIKSVYGTAGNGLYLGGSAGLAVKDVTDGSGNYVGDFLDKIGGSFTISYYAKVDTAKASDANARVFSAGNNGSDEGSSGLAIYLGENKLRYHAMVGTTGWWNAASEVTGADQWHQFVMVYDAGAKKLTTYVDGTQAAQTAANADEPESNWNFCIGGCWAQWDWFTNKNATTESFIGSVDEFKVFSGAVYSMDEINSAIPASKATVTNPNAVEAADMIAYYDFNDSSDFGKDATLNKNNLTKIVNPGKITAISGVSGNAAYFGGSAGLAIGNVSNEDATYAGDFLDNIDGGFTISYNARIDTSKALNDTNARIFCNGINGQDIGSTALVKYLSDGNKVQNITAVGSTGWWKGAAEAQNADAWHHYVLVYDPEAEKLTTFIDGVKVVETYADSEENINADWNFCIGGCWAQWDWFTDKTVTTESFIGAIDEFKVFNKSVYDMNYIVNAVPASANNQPSDTNPIDTTTTEKDTETTDGTTATTTETKNVETGDGSPFAIAVLTLIAAGSVLISRKKR